MKTGVKLIARTAMFIAPLVAFQWVTKPLGQLVTGSCVNLILAVAAMTCGLFSAAIVALCSPFLAFVLGIGPQIIAVVPAIAVGNLVYIAVICAVMKLLSGKVKNPFAKGAVGIVFGALLKFLSLYLLIVKLIVPTLVASATIAEKQAAVLGASFGATQLVTALIGGALAVAVVPAVKKAVK